MSILQIGDELVGEFLVKPLGKRLGNLLKNGLKTQSRHLLRRLFVINSSSHHHKTDTFSPYTAGNQARQKP
ncbi:hypothetical protein [Moraxella caviae]|uniref:hypothetical protein n=1 Tax=Moraxella caviae TaxID=34060 RepID=UPI001054886E|nr:hypothetical protein [Moraxella caviae]